MWTEKQKQRQKAWRLANKGKESKKHKDGCRRRVLKHLYNMTLEDYNSLFIKQEGRCAICGTHQSELKRALCVDHNHATGKVRGLLCDYCNHALGKSRENIEILYRMIAYLEE